MKKEYDFSKAEKGKFFRKTARLNFPIYLNTENLDFVQRLAKKRKSDVTSVVNDLLKGDQALAEALG